MEILILYAVHTKIKKIPLKQFLPLPDIKIQGLHPAQANLCEEQSSFFTFRFGLSDVPIDCNWISEGILYVACTTKMYCDGESKDLQILTCFTLPRLQKDSYWCCGAV
jgi:hypothetical protein